MSIPTQIGRYQVVGHLASGGMAEILLGKLIGPSGFERPVVIKRILPHLAKRERFVNMFLDEARVVARIRHANVVHVHELGREDGELFMVMEYLEGESLLSIMRRSRRVSYRLPIPLAAHIVAQACAGLHAAHELKDDAGQPLGLVHRDVSPHNIFVTYDGAVKLLDFGIAKFTERSTDTEAGQLKGKFPYMSPEQCLGKPLDRRSDIFSLGTILFELTTGRRLFARETGLLSMNAIIHDAIPPPRKIDPAYPAELTRIVERALTRDRHARYQTAADMRREIVSALRTLGFDDIPEDALATQMRQLFVDCKSEKEEMLRRVSSGSSITNVPEAEVDVSIELPAVTGATGVGPVSTPLAVESMSGRARARGSAWKLGAGVALALAAVVGLSVALSGSSDEDGSSTADRDVAPAAAPPAPAETPAASEPPATSAPTAPAQAVDVEPAEVTLFVRSTPAGALVTIAGEERGPTPIEVALPRGDTAVDVAIAHTGFETVDEVFVPANDGRIVVTLPALPPAVVRRARPVGTMRAAEPEPPSPFRRFN